MRFLFSFLYSYTLLTEEQGAVYVRTEKGNHQGTRRRRENEFKWATTRDRREQLVDQLDPELFFSLLSF